MPDSDIQTEANRCNAQHSTGPKTPAGKAASSGNARRHGLASRDVVLPEENKEQFEEFHQALRADFQPQTAFEDSLVFQLAAAQWRLLRVVRIENGLISARLEDLRERFEIDPPEVHETDPEYAQTTQLMGRAFSNSCDGDSFIKLLRYDNTVRRAFYKALQELKAAQQRRAAPGGVPPAEK
ncbi:MAG: hypothetical protein ABSD56_00870 [Bryobacteraceae bacterium]